METGGVEEGTRGALMLTAGFPDGGSAVMDTEDEEDDE